jgi:hypothetical protein
MKVSFILKEQHHGHGAAYEKWWKGLKTQAWRLFFEITGLFLDLQVATLL